MGKTYISLLQEVCFSKQLGAPTYNVIQDVPLDFIVVVSTQLNDNTGEGKGRTKKEARHNAAKELLEELNLLKTHDEELSLTKQDSCKKKVNLDSHAINLLGDFCLNYNLPIVEFRDLCGTGPSNNPVFTVECRISSIVRNGQGTTKKGAKHVAAEQVFDIVKEVIFIACGIKTIFKFILKFQLITPDGVDTDAPLQFGEVDNSTGLLQMYRKWKNEEDDKKFPGTTVANRCNFFKNLNPKNVAIANEILLESNETTSEIIIRKLLESLELKYEFTKVGENGMEFELIKKDFDCLIYNTCYKIYDEVLNYLKDMLK